MNNPTPTVLSTTSTPADQVVHLVCGCQLDDSDTPFALPVVAFCGWRDHDPEQTDDLRNVCAKCVDVFGCPVCSAGVAA